MLHLDEAETAVAIATPNLEDFERLAQAPQREQSLRTTDELRWRNRQGRDRKSVV